MPDLVVWDLFDPKAELFKVLGLEEHDPKWHWSVKRCQDKMVQSSSRIPIMDQQTLSKPLLVCHEDAKIPDPGLDSKCHFIKCFHSIS